MVTAYNQGSRLFVCHISDKEKDLVTLDTYLFVRMYKQYAMIRFDDLG